MSSVVGAATSNLWGELDAQKIEETEKMCSDFGLSWEDHCILVNASTQRLHLIALRTLKASYPVSTALNGLGQKEGTGQTPLGLHFIDKTIGDEAQPFAVFRSRKRTGEIAEADVGEHLIVGRILWLQGAQPGFNQGKDLEGNVVDSKARYIYIHGTNDIANIGKPVSQGCIRMKPDDVIHLFAQVSEQTPVYIYKT
jgi:hypothetical protein